MTAIPTERREDDSDDGRRRRSVTPNSTTSSSIPDSQTISNADLYNASTPPAYTVSAAADETSLGAQATTTTPTTTQAEKPPLNSNDTNPTSTPTDLPPNYSPLTLKPCALLPTHPAIWTHKQRNNLPLSALAATTLLKAGFLRNSDLELISTRAGIVVREPTDPLTAVAFGVYDTVGDILLGLGRGPVELERQLGPMLARYGSADHGGREKGKKKGGGRVKKEEEQEEEGVGGDEDDTASHASSKSSHGAANIAIESGKGLGRVVGAGLKAPMTFTHGLTRGFHNLPKVYGEEVRTYENVTDVKSGFLVSAKGLGYGIGDGLKDFFTKPVYGAQQEGVLGGIKGFGKGLGNLVCKPAAGGIGVVGYSSVGIYKSIQSLGSNFSTKGDTVDKMRQVGEVEFEKAEKDTRDTIIRKWCEVQMSGK